MFGDVDWTNAGLAGAFVLGAILGTIATIRIVRAVSSTLREERRKDRDDGAIRLDVVTVLEVVVLALTAIYIADKIWR